MVVGLEEGIQFYIILEKYFWLNLAFLSFGCCIFFRFHFMVDIFSTYIIRTRLIRYWRLLLGDLHWGWLQRSKTTTIKDPPENLDLDHLISRIFFLVFFTLKSKFFNLKAFFVVFRELYVTPNIPNQSKIPPKHRINSVKDKDIQKRKFSLFLLVSYRNTQSVN